MNTKAMTKMFSNGDARVYNSYTNGTGGPSYQFEIHDGRKQLVEDTYKTMGA